MTFVDLPEQAIALAKEMTPHLLTAWATDGKDLIGLADDNAAELDLLGWPSRVTSTQARFIAKLLEKVADSDWIWEVQALTGRDPAEFSLALARLPASSAAAG